MKVGGGQGKRKNTFSKEQREKVKPSRNSNRSKPALRSAQATQPLNAVVLFAWLRKESAMIKREIIVQNAHSLTSESQEPKEMRTHVRERDKMRVKYADAGVY